MYTTLKSCNILLCILLTGCASNHEKLGINALEWESYSPERQKIVLTNYDTLTKERATIFTEYKIKKAIAKPHLTINISDGKIMFPPDFINWQKYKPIEFIIVPEQCLEIEVVSFSSANIQTKLGACLYDNTLYLDPSHYDITQKLGSIRIPYSPLWLEDFSYKGINSSGYIKFNNVTIEIKQINS